jgi:hypothetical protein
MLQFHLFLIPERPYYPPATISGQTGNILVQVSWMMEEKHKTKGKFKILLVKKDVFCVKQMIFSGLKINLWP